MVSTSEVVCSTSTPRDTYFSFSDVDEDMVEDSVCVSRRPGSLWSKHAGEQTD